MSSFEERHPGLKGKERTMTSELCFSYVDEEGIKGSKTRRARIQRTFFEDDVDASQLDKEIVRKAIDKVRLNAEDEIEPECYYKAFRDLEKELGL